MNFSWSKYPTFSIECLDASEILMRDMSSELGFSLNSVDALYWTLALDNTYICFSVLDSQPISFLLLSNVYL